MRWIHGRWARGTLAGAGLVLVLSSPAAATTTENFNLRTGADLVALCATDLNDPFYTAAIHMCHGFGVGVYHAVQALTAGEKMQPLFCPPAEGVSRNQAIESFVAWAANNGQNSTEPPAEFLGRFLIQEYPCGSK
jgi:hypothetical protein